MNADFAAGALSFFSLVDWIGFGDTHTHLTEIDNHRHVHALPTACLTLINACIKAGLGKRTSALISS